MPNQEFMAHESNDQEQWDRLEQRREFIHRIRAILPLPLDEIREVEKQYADDQHPLGGLLWVSRSGIHIYSSASENKPTDYAPNKHIIAVCKLFHNLYHVQNPLVIINRTRSVRCPNCGHGVPSVMYTVEPEDLVLVVCPDLSNYIFFQEGKELPTETPPYKNLAFEYKVSPWL